jgi:hypothetical protein
MRRNILANGSRFGEEPEGLLPKAKGGTPPAGLKPILVAGLLDEINLLYFLCAHLFC